MFSQSKFEQYKELDNEFEERAEQVLEEISTIIKGYRFTNDAGDPLSSCSSISVEHFEISNGDCVDITVNYRFRPCAPADVFDNDKFDCHITAQFPAKYLWESGWQKRLSEDMASGLATIVVEGDTSKIEG